MLAFFVFLCYSSFSQKIRFTDNTNQWKWFVIDCHSNGTRDTSFTDGFGADTTMSGIVYRRLTTHSSFNDAFVREDTVAHKVYIKAWSIAGPLQDSVLYDYTLGLADTFRCYNNNEVFYVQHFDSVIINSTWHKTWHFVLAHAAYPIDTSFDVVEGIGSLKNPLNPILNANTESCTKVTCFQNHSATPALSATIGGYFNNTTSCSLTFPSETKTISARSQVVWVVPNPVVKESRVLLSAAIKAGSLTIVNSLGQVTYETVFQGQSELPLGDKILVPGIYCYRIVDNVSGELFVGKFVKE